MNSLRLIKYWLPVCLWMLVIYWMSTGAFSSDNTSRIIEPLLYFLFPDISKESVSAAHVFIRKMGHVTEYFVLGLLLFRAFRGTSQHQWNIRWAILAASAAAFYALTDEYHQSFVSTRTASLSDVGIDSAGAVLSQLIVALYCRWRTGRKSVL